MEGLPVELLTLIFYNIHDQELLQTCSVVCKCFLNILRSDGFWLPRKLNLLKRRPELSFLFESRTESGVKKQKTTLETWRVFQMFFCWDESYPIIRRMLYFFDKTDKWERLLHWAIQKYETEHTWDLFPLRFLRSEIDTSYIKMMYYDYDNEMRYDYVFSVHFPDHIHIHEIFTEDVDNFFEEPGHVDIVELYTFKKILLDIWFN